ncbi:YebC-like protein [Collybia nuda]|uniref:YebC-like protein n=1 Tax=Collybia nuda TaxID=64659 RepID=A0A9P5YBV1_9AGAR|nr:YebC-like protein [Collybia nuda]
MLKVASRFLVAQRSFSSSHVNLSGHNKWSKIKQKKGANDAQKGAIFGKANRDIIAAVRSGGSADPNKNLQLAAILKRAKEQDIPKENIEKALAKASQNKIISGEKFIYEAMFDSVGLIIECSTDNSNRTIHSLREILNAYSARAAPVKFMFQRKGRISIPLDTVKDDSIFLDKLVEVALEAGADDFDTIDDELLFTCPTEKLSLVEQSLIKNKANVAYSQLVYLPLELASGLSEETENNLQNLLDELDTNEDVYRVWHTLDNK